MTIPVIPSVPTPELNVNVSVEIPILKLLWRWSIEVLNPTKETKLLFVKLWGAVAIAI